jgi:catechol 2,3-dioxygenase-like lactoylglutathione lyase family enzyme
MIVEQTAQQLTTEQELQTSPIRVRKIGHVVYRVRDVERSKQFWTEILGFKVSDINEKGMVFLRTASDHHTVALAPAPAEAELPDDERALIVDHFAMEVPSVEDLFRAREFLKARGVRIYFEGRRGPGCNMGIEFFDPDGYLIELYADMEQIGWDGKSRPKEMWRRARSLEEAVANPIPGG